MASDKEKDRSLNGFSGRSQETNRSRDTGGTNSVGSTRSDKEADRSLGGGGGGGLNRGGMMGNRESQAASRESTYSGRGGMNSPGEGARSSGSSVGGREAGDVGGMARDVGQVGNGLRGGMAMERATDLASARRASENASMDTYSRAIGTSTANGLRAGLAQSARASETDSMYALGDWGKQVKSVVEAGAGWTTVELNDGTIERRAGDRAARNNNPGNIMASDFADSMGAIGHDFATSKDIAAGRKKGFAVFGSKEDGLAAQAGWFAKEAKKNPNITLGRAISKYAPSFENNTAAYTAALAKAGGVTKDTKLSEISPDQMKSLLSAQHSVEGNTGFRTAEVAPGKSYGSKRTGPAKSDFADTPQVASVPTPRSTAFETKYLGATPADTVAMEYSNATTARNAAPAQPVQHTPAEARAEFEQDQRVASAYESTPGPKAASPAPQVATAETAPPVQTATRVDAAPPTTVQPETPETVKPTLASATTEDAPQERTTGQQVAATGVDIGMGLIPGIGMGLSLVNGALALTGNRTLGERVIDAIGTGDGTGFNPADRSDPNRREKRERKEKATTTIAANPKRFEEKYLAFVDTTKRPTPAEKWGTGTSNYGAREYG